MRISELLRLVFINLSQNKFKVFLTSVGIIVGTGTIMLVIAIGTGGKLEVAEQFKNLNAGTIDITYESDESEFQSSGNHGGGPGGGMMPPSMGHQGMSGGMGNFGGGPGGRENNEQKNQEKIILGMDDIEDIEVFVPGIADTTISYTETATVEGGELDESASYTVAGVKENYRELSNMEMLIGDFLSEENDENKDKTCVLGYTVAKEIFDSIYDAYDSVIYINNRPYVVGGILSQMGSVSSGISPDTSIFIPYQTGIKYITGSDISPTITVIAQDIDMVSTVIENIKTVLADSYPNAEFTISDAGSKMEAASKSNETLQLLLIAMAVIVFIVGGIGIMNVLFVSVKERTNEIGILKALGCSRKDILLEFLLEAGCMSLIGGSIGVMLALGITPIVEQFHVRVELSVSGAVLSLIFGIVTGTIFGFYPAYKASTLVPVAALNAE